VSQEVWEGQRDTMGNLETTRPDQVARLTFRFFWVIGFQWFDEGGEQVAGKVNHK
jgi:hypothetical protein